MNIVDKPIIYYNTDTLKEKIKILQSEVQNAFNRDYR